LDRYQGRQPFFKGNMTKNITANNVSSFHKGDILIITDAEGNKTVTEVMKVESTFLKVRKRGLWGWISYWAYEFFCSMDFWWRREE
jgi:hypothetical protein